MQKTILVVFSACALFFIAHAPKAKAQSVDLLSKGQTYPVTTPKQNIEDVHIIPFKLNVPDTVTPAVEEIVPAQPVPTPEVPAEPIVHEVAAGQSLSTIAKLHNTTWVRLFNKNETIVNPDIISAGQKITVPLQDEQLIERPLPQPPVVEPESQPVQKTGAASAKKSVVARSQPKPSAPVQVSVGSSAGNTYYKGYCTWYAKSMRPDLPNNLGNASTWVLRAAAQGIPTGSTPRVGAIGQQSGHVVYVQRVNGDGTIFISEMNYNGAFNRVTTRTAAASNFRYIY